MTGSRTGRTGLVGTVVLLIGFALLLPGLFVLVAHAMLAVSGDTALVGGTAVAVTRVAIAFAVLAAGTFLFHKGATLRTNARKMCVVDGWTLLKQDTRPPILYLRSFRDDEQTTKRAAPSVGNAGALAGAMTGVVSSMLGSASGAHRTQEEELVAELGELGPCIAVGEPSEALPDLGASRIYLDEQWQIHVAALMTRAQLILFRIGSQSPGFWWEVERVCQSVPSTRVAFWIPPANESGEDPREIFDRFAARLQPHVPYRLPEWRYGAKLLRFRTDWRAPYLTPSLTDGPKIEWPKDTSRHDAIFQKALLVGVGILLVVQIARGALSPMELIKGSLLGSSYSTPSPPPVRSAAILESAIKQANPSLPKMIDPETELMKMSSSEGLLVYHYRLVKFVDTIVDASAVATLRSRIADSVCATRSTRELIDHDVTLRYTYVNQTHTPLVSVHIDRVDCIRTIKP